MAKPYKSTQQGVALLSALIITGIAITLAATLSYRQYLSIRLTSNLSELEQAYHYVHSMEDFAIWALTKDAKHSTLDSLDEKWNQPIAQPIPGGHLSGRLYDLNSRINLNDLVHFHRDEPTGEFISQVDQVQLTRFKRLLNYLNLPETIADPLIDWMDMDQIARSSGAESDYYLSLNKPYITSNSHLASLSELRLIKTFNKPIDTPDDQQETKKVLLYNRLKPFVSALPPNNLPININTASVEVLHTLGDIDSTLIENIIADRETVPFESINDFITATGLQLDNANGTSQNNQPARIQEQSIDVISTYFLLKGMIQIGRAHLYVNTILHRDKEGKVTITQREFIKHIL